MKALLMFSGVPVHSGVSKRELSAQGRKLLDILSLMMRVDLLTERYCLISLYYSPRAVGRGITSGRYQTTVHPGMDSELT